MDFPELKARHDGLAIYVQSGAIPSQNLAVAYNAYNQAAAAASRVPPDSPGSWTAKIATGPACADIPMRMAGFFALTAMDRKRLA